MAFHHFGRPRPERLQKGTVILFRPVAFSPVWVCIECGMGNPKYQALMLHTRNGGGTIRPLVFETYGLDLCWAVSENQGRSPFWGAGPPNCPLSGRLV